MNLESIFEVVRIRQEIREAKEAFAADFQAFGSFVMVAGRKGDRNLRNER